MEGEVLAGASGQIVRHRPILYVENDRRENSAGLIRMIDELGYDASWHMPQMFNPNNFHLRSQEGVRENRLDQSTLHAQGSGHDDHRFSPSYLPRRLVAGSFGVMIGRGTSAE
jgi:hypothetical protein